MSTVTDRVTRRHAPIVRHWFTADTSADPTYRHVRGVANQHYVTTTGGMADMPVPLDSCDIEGHRV
jgi:hypothetical protein